MYYRYGIRTTQSEDLSLVPGGRELDLQMEYRIGSREGGRLTGFAFHALDSGHLSGATESGLGLKLERSF